MKNFKIILNEQEIELLEKLLNYSEKVARSEESKRIIVKLNEKIRRIQSDEINNQFPYIERLDEDLKEYFFRLTNEYEVDLYHSLANLIGKNKLDNTDELYEKYKMKNQINRPNLFSDEEKLKRILSYVYNRLKIKGKI